MKNEEEVLRQLGFLMRFANRINNTKPELVNDSVRVAIEKAKEIIRLNSNIKDSDKIKQS